MTRTVGASRGYRQPGCNRTTVTALPWVEPLAARQRKRSALEMHLLQLGCSRVEQVADQILRQGQAVQR